MRLAHCPPRSAVLEKTSVTNFSKKKTHVRFTLRAIYLLKLIIRIEFEYFEYEYERIPVNSSISIMRWVAVRFSKLS